MINNVFTAVGILFYRESLILAHTVEIDSVCHVFVFSPSTKAKYLFSRGLLQIFTRDK